MSPHSLALIFFVYGLAFFGMGLAITLEMGHGSDPRLRHALRSLAVFGLIHGGHEWMEMFEKLAVMPPGWMDPLAWNATRIAILELSFLALAAFGASLLSPNESVRRYSLALPIGMALVWGLVLLVLANRHTAQLWDVADVWTRYSLAIPGALVASAGLFIQHGAFQRAGMAQFGRDSLWAGAAFALYGVVGQVFTRSSTLYPSTFLNQDLFLSWFGFPVQLLRAAAATAVAISVTRFLRSREVEIQRQIAALQAARLDEAQRREALRSELFRRVVGAQEAERQRIARELHDETGQALTAIGLGLRGVRTMLAQDAARASNNLRSLENLTQHSLNELQRVIADLRPSQLDDLGLPAALRWYGEQVASRAPHEVSVEVTGEPRDIPSTVSTALFRVAQEALTNVVRHAHASYALVHLEFVNDSLRLRVADNGRGFDPARVGSETHTWGLLGMEERVHLLGGTMKPETAPGYGTMVEVTLPYPLETGVPDDHKSASG
ncbi:MAG: sensor histidine kinase [Chloroflexota bacterium]